MASKRSSGFRSEHNSSQESITSTLVETEKMLHCYYTIAKQASEGDWEECIRKRFFDFDVAPKSILEQPILARNEDSKNFKGGRKTRSISRGAIKQSEHRKPSKSSLKNSNTTSAGNAYLEPLVLRKERPATASGARFDSRLQSSRRKQMTTGRKRPASAKVVSQRSESKQQQRENSLLLNPTHHAITTLLKNMKQMNGNRLNKRTPSNRTTAELAIAYPHLLAYVPRSVVNRLTVPQLNKKVQKIKRSSNASSQNRNESRKSSKKSSTSNGELASTRLNARLELLGEETVDSLKPGDRVAGDVTGKEQSGSLVLSLSKVGIKRSRSKSMILLPLNPQEKDEGSTVKSRHLRKRVLVPEPDSQGGGKLPSVSGHMSSDNNSVGDASSQGDRPTHIPEIECANLGQANNKHQRVSVTNALNQSMATLESIPRRKSSLSYKMGSIPQCKSFAQISLRTDDNTSSKSQRNMLGFIPRVELRRLSTKPEPLTEPHCISFEASAMFVDISGFTKLTERLTNDPDIQSGAEMLTKILNGFFDELLAVIEEYGGDVVKFCGDAILVVFQQSQHLEDVTLCSCVCALAVQSRFSNYDTGSGTSFSVHMGIGAGTVHSMYVGGGFERWEVVFAGEPMLQIKTATDDAKAGETVLSPEAWKWVGNFADGTTLPSRNVRLESMTHNSTQRVTGMIAQWDLSIPLNLDPSTYLAVRKYVPGAVLSRLTAGQSWMEINELRQVTIIFFNTPMLEVKEAEELSELQEIAIACQSALYWYEGSVNKFLVDDKGSTLIGAFGLPPCAHEDDAVRGLQCGLLMRTNANRLGVKCSVGIASGKIFCGILGSQTRCEYAVMGDTVNVSARLMQYCSPDGILCDETTFTLSSKWLDSRNIRCQPIEPIQVKGKSNKLAVYRPEPSQVNHGQVLQTLYSKQPNSMVGRLDERELIERQFMSYLDQHSESACIWLEGDAGIGKSEFVAYAYQLSKNHGFHMCLGAANSVEQTTSYYPWRSLISELFTPRVNQAAEEVTRESGIRRHTVANETIAQTVPKVLANIDPEFVPLAALLNVVLPVDFNETAASRSLPTDSRAASTHEMLVRIIQYFVEQERYVFTIEDCHWMDSKSLALLLDVTKRVKPLLVIATSRPMEAATRGKGRKRRSSMIVESSRQKVPAEYHKIKLLPTTHFLYLEEMDLDVLCAIVAMRLDVRKETLPSLVVDVISTKAKGNPFVALELICHMRETGCLNVKDDHTCEISDTVTSLDDIEFPENVRGLITGRVDRLKVGEQLVLRIASAIGRVFDYMTLHTCLQKLDSSAVADSDLKRMLNDLQNNGFIQYNGLHATKGCDEFHFDMDIVQDVVYHRMSYAHRRVVHCTVAKYIEESHQGKKGLHNQLLAHHYKKADMMGKAVHYLSEAGREAFNINATSEAVKIFLEALKLYNVAIKRQVSKQDEDDPYADIPVHDNMRLAEWHSFLCSALTDLGDLNNAKIHCEQAMVILDKPFPKTADAIKLRLLQEVVRQYVISKRRGIWDETQTDLVATVEQANTMAEAEQKRLLLASETHAMMGRLTYFSGNQYAQAYSILRSLNLALKAKKVSAQLARCYATACLAAVTFGAFQKAERYSREALIIAEAVDDPSASLYIYIITSLFYIQVGALNDADDGLIQAIVIAAKLGNLRRWEEAHNLRALVAHLSAKHQQSSNIYAAATVSAKKRGDDQMQARLLIGRSGALITMHQVDLAAELLHQLDNLARSGNLKTDVHISMSKAVMNAALCIQKGQHNKSFLHLSRTVKVLKGIDNPTQVASLSNYCFAMDVGLYLLQRTKEYTPRSGFTDKSLGPDPALDSEKILEIVKAALAAFEILAQKFLIAEPWYFLYSGIFYLLEGDEKLSKENFDACQQVASKMELRITKDLARGWGAFCIFDDDKRHEIQRQCVESCLRAGSAWHGQILEDQIARSGG